MSEMESVLIVGGLHDGERVKVEYGMPYLDRYEPAPPPRSMPWETPITAIHVRKVRYLRQKFGTPDGQFMIFAPEGASYAETMQRLLDGYRPITTDKA